MKAFVAAALATSLVAACGLQEKKIDPAAHATEIRQWQKTRAERLAKEDSWLTLIGLHWLKDGENTVTLTKAGAPPVKLTRNGAQTILHPDPSMTIDGKPLAGDVPLLADADEKGPTIVQMGSVRFNVIKRGDRYGLRVKDAEAETRTHFKGLEYYPIDPKWRVEARFEAYHPPKKIPITDVTGMTSDSISPGAIVFDVDGEEYRIDPILEEGSTDYFIIFRDATSKDTTYPAGRYLYAAPPKDGKMVVDFNKAYNPPCAFTPFATCPLPPLQNRLPFRIEAGEKKYAGGDH
ncbi:MAG TPA: DUF1684 domain-containing protein [Thermoanaerobaculia bacterium]|nr:DUF1684 domain-containing protein [Thermoanaerobaculia bacterium]